MDERVGKIRCIVMIALSAVLLKALLPASFIGGLVGLKTATLFDQGSDLLARIFVLAGMVAGLMISSLIIMLLVNAIDLVVTSRNEAEKNRQLPAREPGENEKFR